MGVNTEVATLVVTNTEDEPVYLVFKISCLSAEREHKLRVICNNESREVGIQRRDLNLSHLNITQINSSSYLDGRCPFCNSSDLTFYDLPPDVILEGVHLRCDDNPLKLQDGRYETMNKVEPRDDVHIAVILDIPDEKRHYGKNWELRILVMSAEEIEDLESGGVMLGPETKLLIDTAKQIEETESSSNAGFILLFMIIVGAVLSSAIIILIKKGKELVPETKPNKRRHT